jgi:hypothetical protein
VTGTEIGLQPIDAGDGMLIIIAVVSDLTARREVLQIIERHFPDAAVKFEP